MPRGTLPDALYWDMGDPYHYVRLNPGPGSIDYLIAGGADHKTGEADDGDVRFEAVEAWIRSAGAGSWARKSHRWSGQVLIRSTIAASSAAILVARTCLVATGDSGQGMTHGALAGILFKDLIVDGSSPWEAVYDPRARRRPAIGISSART